MSDPSKLGDDDDHPLEHSSLERDITRDGVTVRLFIYRGREDAGWILEIEDEQGGSTVWDDPFDTDQAALAEALWTIDEDGIRSVADKARDRATDRAVWELAMEQPIIAELRRVLDASHEAMSFHGACGVFAAVASAPQVLRPGAWLDMIKGERAQDAARRTLSLSSRAPRRRRGQARALAVSRLGTGACGPSNRHLARRGRACCLVAERLPERPFRRRHA